MRVCSGGLDDSGELRLVFPLVFLIPGFVRGFGVAYLGHLVHKVAKDSQNVCADIVWLHVPMRLAEFATIVSFGFLAQIGGFTPVFALKGAFWTALSLPSVPQLARTNRVWMQSIEQPNWPSFEGEADSCLYDRDIAICNRERIQQYGNHKNIEST